MRLRALLAAAVLLVSTACASGSETGTVPPGDPDIPVDTPDLVQLREAAQIEPCVPGTATSALPALTLPCLGGGPDVDLSTLPGPMVINLWASTCGPCRTEMPILQEFHETYADQAPVVGVDLMDTLPGVALKQIRRRGVTYPQLADPGGDLLETPAFARATRLPSITIIDAAGEVQSQTIGGVSSVDELTNLVEDALDVELAPR